MENSSEIKISIALDENQVPEKMHWLATDNGDSGVCDAMLMSLWDPKEMNSLRIDLWTKNMSVEDMKIFFYQSILSMADTFERATSEQEMAMEMRDFGLAFGEKMKLIKNNS